MSEEMAVSDNTTGEEDRVTSDEPVGAIITEPAEVSPEHVAEAMAIDDEDTPDSPPPEVDPEEQGEPAEPFQMKGVLHYDESEPSSPEEPNTFTETNTIAEPNTFAETNIPAEPSSPVEPSSPAEPSNPAELSALAEPNTTAEPSTAAEPSTPAEPSAPVEPSTPVEPVTPEEPSNLTEPSIHAEPSILAEPSMLGEPSILAEQSTPEESISEVEQMKEEEEDDPPSEVIEEPVAMEENGDDTRGMKRRASIAFSDNDDDEEFKGFDDVKVDVKTDDIINDEEFKGFEDSNEEVKTDDYNRILERLQSEVLAATKTYVPLRTVMATPPATRATKRPRKDTDGSRPSSALSSRSEGDGSTDASSPASRGGRRPTTEMSSPLLRIPLERGWKRELVYRAALDPYAKRNGDIYYYTPQGKKLRSTREVAEHLAGTGLTLENFSFFKEPLGVDDPEKEIIRDAKLMRRIESPGAPTTLVVPVEGKRTPKPKMPKGASPEPQQNATQAAVAVKSPPVKIKVKSLGSRLSTSTPAPAPVTALKEKQQQQQQKKPSPPVSTTPDNNNSASWKKPRTPAPPTQPPPLVSRPPGHAQPTGDAQSPRQLVQPCSMTCGRGVPTLTCAACLCMYHAACAGYVQLAPPDTFLCKNCRKSTSPPLEPPPLTHKSGITTAGLPVPIPVTPPVPRRVPIPVPVPVPAKVPRDKRVLLRMKVSGGTPDGERVWAVSDNQPRASSPPKSNNQPQPTQPSGTVPNTGRARTFPQSLAVLNGRRFIIVPRAVIQANTHDASRRSRVANGASSPTMSSPRRRGRPRVDETDHFTAFYNKAQENNYNVVVQIFQYLGMRDLAHCGRVCRLWRQLAATPALWRHVRMKNSQVSDWAGLCAALQRHGTKRLDLRKMLLPAKDAEFWDQFGQHIGNVSSLERIEMCRCPASAVEAVCRGLPGLRALSALAIRDAFLDPTPLAALPLLHELRLKSMAGLSLTKDLRHLAALTRLQHLSLTSIKELGCCLCDVIGSLTALESLELGECTFQAEFAGVLARLDRLRRLRLERGTPHCAAPDILRSLATLPLLTRLELVNIDVKPGFDDALALCTNVQRLLIIPTYVSQSATTNRQVLSGVLRLKDTLTHLMWGVTIELLRVTELFIDQCEQSGEAKRRDVGECIPVLKPVPGCRLPDEPAHVAGPPQVEILPLPTLQRLLSAQLPNTRLKLLRIPFHATWRQSLADFQ